MPDGELIIETKRHPEFRTYEIRRADAALAARLPDLGAPRMGEAARAAFRAILDHEKPTANAALADVLRLAQARGFCAHPGDWLPGVDGGYRAPALYQPWIEWLSEHGFTPFHEHNALTPENFGRWKPKPRLDAFRALVREDAQAALRLLQAVGAAQSAATRLDLLNTAARYGDEHPRKLPLLQYFLDDRAAKVKDAAAAYLQQMSHLKSEAAQAAELAARLVVRDDGVTYQDPQAQTPLMGADFLKTTFALLAEALDLSPQDLARRAKLEELGSNFTVLAVLTEDVEIRAIVAERLLDAKRDFNVGLFRGLARPLRERGLRATFKSAYRNQVGEFLGLEAGSLNEARAREWMSGWEEAVAEDLAHGGRTVHPRHDPLRALALVVDKPAAGAIVERTLAMGMKPDDPRLAALRFNLAL